MGKLFERIIASRLVVHLSEEALAISLDIVNTFNTLPWEIIPKRLRYHQVPTYLQDVIGDYPSDKWVKYPDRSGTLAVRETRCGVPQGSVLGPVLWHIGYDAYGGTSVPCYADDTIVVVIGEGYRRTLRLAECGVACVVRK
ncbi:hypothetical protein KM043_013189 [Ampulex compressa]|nr:hypothetical protein KM043_013189 [Ampulex compressa]